ncbi:MAG TPA: Mut7-C RNAse domain-containing protein [Candidatus Binatia bacterium]|nr:Mut7-C RNAse domain-containing protein [Candidatus Binatia bacterium]
MSDAPAGSPGVRFAVDVMLGRLARWLRILGHDVVYQPQLRGRALARVARREGRWLLTRDTRLLRERELPPHLFVTSDHFREQLRQVAAAVPLGRTAPLSRCLDCNRALEEAARDVVRERVPAYVWTTQERFLRCPRCGKLYWGATHRRRMLAELAALGLAAAEHDDGRPGA